MNKRLRPHFAAKFLEYEAMLRGGQHSLVKIELDKIKASVVPPANLFYFANLLRRAGSATRAIRVLSPFVNSKTRRTLLREASTAEQAELAAALNAIGATDQALHLLGPLDAELYPRVLLYRAFCGISQWSYADAEQDLSIFLKSPLDHHEKVLAQSNLAACLVAEEKAESDPLLKELERVIGESGFEFLRRHINLLRAQRLIQLRDRAGARRLLEATSIGLASETTKLLIAKWSWIIAAEDSKTVKSRAELLNEWIQLKETAARLYQGEIWRDLDLQKALVWQDSELLRKVYFGTPHLSYRKKIIAEAQQHFGKKLAFDADFYWYPGGRRGQKGVTQFINRETGATSRPKIFFKSETVLFRLLQALSSDYYRFWNIPALHSKLFGKRIFDPDSSTSLVQEHVQRLRRELQEKRLGLRLVRSRNLFHLESEKACCILQPAARSPVDAQEQLWLGALRAVFKSGIFNRLEAERALGVSGRSTQRILKALCDAGVIVVAPAGRSTRYTFGSG